MKCKNKYRPPIKKKDVIKFWGSNASDAHIGKLKHSVDFECEEGSPLYAALGGTVVWLKNDSKIRGLGKKYHDDGNRIVIKHKNNEYTAYEHLRYKGAIVKVGQKVKKGQLIGYSGNTGDSDGPHLHFEVFTDPDDEESEGVTLKIRFDKFKTERELVKYFKS